eukprot:5374327-Amphidinium_carterae.2
MFSDLSSQGVAKAGATRVARTFHSGPVFLGVFCCLLLLNLSTDMGTLKKSPERSVGPCNVNGQNKRHKRLQQNGVCVRACVIHRAVRTQLPHYVPG